MGIINTIQRSSDDLVKPNKKSYWKYELDIALVDVKEITSKVRLQYSEKKALMHELSGIEPVEQIIVIKNMNKKLGRLTTTQVKDIFDDMGFNVDTIVSGLHFCDFTAVMNTGGFLVPGWTRLIGLLQRRWPWLEKVLLSKLAPGRERLHVRFFESNDGGWVITAHTDWNWFNLNLAKIYKSHLAYGTGDYRTGTLMMYQLLLKFRAYMEKNQLFPYHEIERITRWAYYQGLADDLKATLRISVL